MGRVLGDAIDIERVQAAFVPDARREQASLLQRVTTVSS
jgi:hypothetical protein